MYVLGALGRGWTTGHRSCPALFCKMMAESIRYMAWPRLCLARRDGYNDKIIVQNGPQQIHFELSTSNLEPTLPEKTFS